MKSVVIALVLACAAPAGAFTFRIKGQALRLDITESLFTAYNGDLGSLVIEKDRSGRATNNYRFFDILNRLNVDLAWKNLRLFTRFDTAVYFATPEGSCGPDTTT